MKALRTRFSPRLAFAGSACLVISVVAPSLRAEDSEAYVVRAGDTLSEIIFRRFGPGKHRIYGEKNLLETVTRLNSGIENPDLIFPGQKIVFSAADEPADSSPSPSDPTPPPTAPPPPAPVAEFRPFGVTEIFPEIAYTRIDATEKADGSHVSLLSTPELGATFRYRYHLSERVALRARAGIRAEDYEAISGKTLAVGPKARTRFAVGVLLFEENFRLGLRLELAQRSFVRSAGTNDLHIDRASVPELALDFDIPLGASGSLRWRFDPEIGYVAGANTSAGSPVQSGLRYAAALALDYDAGIGTIVTEIFGEKTAQDLREVDTESTSVGIRVGLRLPSAHSSSEPRDDAGIPERIKNPRSP